MAVSIQLSTEASSFSSSFLQNLSNLVQSIHPDRFQVKPGPADKQSPSTFRKCALQCARDASSASPHSDASHPTPPVVPRLSLEVYRSELDEQSEALDIEIEVLMAYWESWSYLTGGCMNPRTSRIGTWDRGHPWDLSDEFIHEDPGYDEERVNREAMEEYLKATGDETSGRAASRNPSATEDKDGQPAEFVKPSTTTRGRPRTTPRATFKKPRVARSKVGASPQPTELKTSSSDNSSEEEEAGSTPKKKRPSGRGSQDKTKKRRASADKNGRLDVPKEKVPKRTPIIRQPTFTAQAKRGQASDSGEQRVAVVQGKFSARKKTPTSLPASPLQQKPSGSQLEKEAGDHPSESSGTSSRPPSGRLYNLRHQNKAPGDDSRKEEGDSDELSSVPDSEEEWAPNSEGSAVGEEEEEDDGEEEEEGDGEEEDDGEEEEQGDEEEDDGGGEEEIENMAGGTRPVRHAPSTRESKGAARRYPCPECGQTFSNSSNRQKHLRIHRKEFPFGCHACGKAYSDPSNLAKHQLSHGGERRHKCPRCPKAFFQKAHLDAHLRRHQGIRPFPCLDCKSSFFRQAELTAHIKIHVFGKGAHRPGPPLRCTDCDKTFAGSRLLRQHQKRHKSFPCEVCGQVFTLKFKYLFHLRSHEVSGESGGAEASGAPLGQSPASLASVTGATLPSTDPGIVACQTPEAATGAGHLTKKPGSGQATVNTLRTGRTSLATRPPIPVNGSNKASAGTKIQSKPPPVPVSARLPSVASTARPEQSSSSHATGSAGKAVSPAGPLQAAQAGVWPQILIRARPVAVALTLVLPNGPALPTSSNPNRGATMPPAGSKLSLELPGQKMVMAQTCPLCHVQYLGKHHCKASCPTPASRMGGEERKRISLKTEEDPALVPQQPAPDLQPPPKAQGEQEAVAHRLRKTRARVGYTSQVEGGGSDSGGGSEDEWLPDESSEEEEEPPAASAKLPRLHFSAQKPTGSRRARRGRARYMCNVCDKHFVHQRSLKQHMRLHFAFSCKQCSASFLRSEQLRWHMFSHAKGMGT